MAKQKNIETEYSNGDIVKSNISDTLTRKNYTYKQVTQLPDGTPLTDEIIEQLSPIYSKTPDGRYWINTELTEYAGKFNNYKFDGYGDLAKGDFHACEGGFARIDSDTICYIFRYGTEYSHTSPTGAIYGSISTDEGATWGEPYLIYSDEYDERNLVVGNAPNGDICVVFARYDTTVPVHLDLWSMVSSDGVNFTTPSQIDRTGVASLVPMGKIWTRGENTYFLNYAGYLSQAHLWESTDNGASWSMVSKVYDMPSIPLYEPFLHDLPNGNSIILIRNQDASPTNISFYQFSSTDGLNYTYDGPTNIEADKGTSAVTPVCVTSKGNDIIVISNFRYFDSEKEVTSKVNFWIADYRDILVNPMAYELKHSIPRADGDFYSTYGYPQLMWIGDKGVGAIADRRRRNPILPSISANEQASLYTFKFDKLTNVEDFKFKKSEFNGVEVKNTLNKNTDYVHTVNTDRGFESSIPTSPQYIWRYPIANPEEVLLGGRSRMALLSAITSEASGGYPQGEAIGGVVLLAQSADAHVKWMIGRGATNENQGVLYCQTYHSTTGEWSGWKALALEETVSAQALVTNPSVNGGSIELLTSGDDVFNVQGSGAFGTSGAITNTPNATNAFVIFNMRVSPTNWAQLAIPSGGANYNSVPVYINNRPGTDAWRPMSMQGTASYETRTNADNDDRYLKYTTFPGEPVIQGGRNWSGQQIYESELGSKAVYRRTAGTNVIRFEHYDGTTATNTIYLGEDIGGSFVVSRDGGLTEVFIQANESGVQVDNLIANSIQGDVVADQPTVDAGVDNSTVVTPLTLQTTLNQGALTNPIPVPATITPQSASTTYVDSELQQVMFNQEAINDVVTDLIAVIDELKTKLDQVITK